MNSKILRNLESEAASIEGIDFSIKQATPIVEGKIELRNQANKVFETYDVRLRFPKKYPYRFPVVQELSNKIPRGEETHIAKDGTLCLEVSPKEIVICRDGISLDFFVDRVLIPHLAIQYIKQRTGKYPFGDYEHYLDGHFQYYKELLMVSDSQTVLKILGGMAYSFKRAKRKPCICGSGKLFEDCHFEIVDGNFGLTLNELRNEYNRLKRRF